MAINRKKSNIAYSPSGQPIVGLAPQPIVALRAPSSSDKAEIGTTWIDTATDAVYTLTSVDGTATWTATAGAAGPFASLEITGGAGTVFTVDLGDSEFTDGDVDIVSGDLSVGGNLDVVGDVTITGDFTLQDTAAITIESTHNGAGAITIDTDGGTSETLVIQSKQGTGAASVDISSLAGGVTVSGALATADAINFVAASGGIDVDAALQINIASSQNAVDAIRMVSSAGGIDIDAVGAATEDINITNTGGSIVLVATENAADSIVLSSSNGGIDITAAAASAGEDIDISAVGSSVNISSTENAAAAITLTSNGGTSETIVVTNTQGTGVASINVVSSAGGITLTSNLATADGINLNAIGGGLDLDGALQVNIASAQAAAANSVRIIASAADGGMDIDSGTGGMTLDTTGALSLDSAATSNFTVTGSGTDLNLTSVGGSVLVESTENVALAIRLHANGGTSETIQVHADQGTGAASIGLLSDVGGITIQSGLAGAASVFINAAGNAGSGLDVNVGTGGATIDSTGVISIDAAGTSNFTTTGAFDLTLSSTAGSTIVSGGEAVIDAVQLTAGNAAGGVRVTSGSLAATTGLNLVQGAVNASIQVGAGDPSHNAPQGSLYIKTDASTAVTRLWINTNGTNGWAFFTASA